MNRCNKTVIPSLSDAAKIIVEVNNLAKIPVASHHWKEIIALQLSPDRHLAEELNIPSKPLQKAATTLLRSPDRLANVCNFRVRSYLGSIARAVKLQLSMGSISSHEAIRLARGAIIGYRIAPDIRDREIDPEIDSAVALALWILGLLEYTETIQKISNKDRLTRNEKRELGTINRWVSGFQTDRVSDLKRLTKSVPDTWRSIDRILKWTSRNQQNMDGFQTLQQRTDLNDSYSPAEKKVFSVWPQRPGFLWQDLGDLTDSDRSLLRQTAQLSQSRGDLLINHESAMIVEPQGFYDSLLTLCTGLVGDEINSRWHEKEVTSAIRTSWASCAKVFTNIEWTQGDAEPTKMGIQVDSEIDTLLLSQDILVDFQAKSARSAQAKQRENTTVSDALRQHQVLHSALDIGAWAVRRTNSRAAYGIHPRIGNLKKSTRVHVPITVGTEAVHLWSVGGGFTNDDFVRVLTTLDHLRVVNNIVPDLFRPTYWLDRYAQEFTDLKFVDEIDFLDKWCTNFRTDNTRRDIQVLKDGLVMSDDSDIEMSIVNRNNYSLLSGGLGANPAIATLLDRSKLNYLNISITNPILVRALSSLRSRAPHDYLLLSRLIIGTNLLTVETTLAEQRDATFPFGIYPWAVHFSNRPIDEVRRLAPEAWVVLNYHAGKWSLTRLVSPEKILESWRRPRFPAPSEL